MAAKQEIENNPGIRPMEPEDITAIFDIDHEITRTERAMTYDDLVTAGVGGELALSFVAEVDSHVVGFILVRHTYAEDPSGGVTEAACIRNIGVAPAYRRRGIATQLVESLIKDCQSKGLKILMLMINEHDNQLKDFFQHLEFRRGELVSYTKLL